MAARAIETADSELCQLQDCQSLMDFPLTLPIIPFTPNEALAPGCTKVLRLYEDKDLELLEAVMAGNVSQTVSDSCDDLQHDPFLEDPQGSHGSGEGSGPGRSRARVFVHSTIEMGSAHTPCVACASSSPGALVQGEFVFFLSTLVQVLDVRCAAHGGLDVTIRGEGRVRISRLKQLNPFITGEVWPVLDMVPREVLQSAQQPTSPWAPWPEQATEEQAPEVARLEQTVRAAEAAPAQQAEGTGAELDGSEEGQRAAAGAEMGWALRAMVQELREVTRDVQGLMIKLGRDEAAAQLSAALQWADDPSPLMCNLGSGSAAAELYCARPGTPSRVGDGHDVGQVSPVLASAVPLPCAVSQLDRATRLSFALLALTQGAGGEGWAGTAAMADPRRAAFCTLDTRERLELVMTSAKSARARLAAQAALRRVRRF